MKNLPLGERTSTDIQKQVLKIWAGLGNPEPPIDLRMVRELLKLDYGYYSSSDDSLLRETVSRLMVAGKQILMRPTLIADAVKTASLKALYFPDQKRILIDSDSPKLKHRWNEAHEIGHDIIPWHRGMMLGDSDLTLAQSCHVAMEAEANYAAGHIIFPARRFLEEATSSEPTFAHIKKMSKVFGNTMTSTLWRFVEQAHGQRPMVALVSGHPHLRFRNPSFDPQNPCRYCVESPEFRKMFSHLTEIGLYKLLVGYCGSQSGGILGEDELVLADSNGGNHLFRFQTFFNRHEALTLGYWLSKQPTQG